MRAKTFALTALIAMMLLALATGCGSNKSNEGAASPAPNASGSASSSADTGGSAAPEKKDVTIKIFQFKVEIAEALQRMAEEYEKETGVHVEVETHGGGEDYGALLKAEFASGSEPEIFNSGGFSALEQYLDRAEDLTNESWAAHLIPAAKVPITVDGKLYGMPMNIEGYGFAYNKDLFAKAGITKEPQTLPELTEAVRKLKDAGITPFMATNEWWSLGIHLVNVGLAYQPDPAQFIEDLKAGKASFKDNAIFKDWLNLVDLIFANAQKDMLTTDYATQVANFAAGKAAMIQQGNWIQGDVDNVDPNLNLGVLPIPINDQPGHVFVGVPNNWIVNKKSKHPDEAKKFLEWMVTSETGKRYLVKEFKFMPAFDNIDATAEDIGDIAVGVKEKAGDALGWQWDRFPDGVTQGFGAAMQEYQGGRISREELLEKLDKAVQDIVKK